jgi:hypothetical protein
MELGFAGGNGQGQPSAARQIAQKSALFIENIVHFIQKQEKTRSFCAFFVKYYAYSPP